MSKFELYMIESETPKYWYDDNYNIKTIECPKCKGRFHVEDDKIKVNHTTYDKCPDCSAKIKHIG